MGVPFNRLVDALPYTCQYYVIKPLPARIVGAPPVKALSNSTTVLVTAEVTKRHDETCYPGRVTHMVRYSISGVGAYRRQPRYPGRGVGVCVKEGGVGGRLT